MCGCALRVTSSGSTRSGDGTALTLGSGKLQTMRTWGITATLITAALLAGCSSAADETPTATTASTSSAPASADVTDQIREAVGSYANLITSAEEPEPGRIEVGTSIVDPRGDDGTPEAEQAVGICQRLKNANPDATSIVVYEQDGTTFAIFGSSWPDCTEV